MYERHARIWAMHIFSSTYFDEISINDFIATGGKFQFHDVFNGFSVSGRPGVVFLDSGRTMLSESDPLS